MTYVRRTKDGTELLNELIWNDLRALAKQDLSDHFTYQVGAAQLDLENAPYGGARYPVSALIDKKLFVRFQLDVGADYLLDEVENIRGNDWLEFCAISPPMISMISIEQQFAEKLHAYTLPRGERPNSRTKDLIDMILLLKMKTSQPEELLHALQQVFTRRGTHPLPQRLAPPPAAWNSQFLNMAAECGLTQNMQENFDRISALFNSIIESFATHAFS